NASTYFGMAAIWDLTSQQLHFKNSDLYGSDNEGHIVLINEDTGAVNITGIGYAIGHYARWVKPGAVRVDATSSDPRVRVSACIDRQRGKIALVLINNAAIPEPVAIKLSGVSLTSNLRGEQSTASGYWKPLAAFAPSVASEFSVLLPQQSVTSLGGRL